MVEGEPKITLGRRIRANSSLLFHDTIKGIFDIPFAIRLARAPEGKIVRGEEIKAEGRVVRYSGETYVVVTKENETAFPNKQAGDEIKLLPQK